MSNRVRGFAAWETIGMVLPNVFLCQECRKLWRCMHQPDPPICQACLKKAAEAKP